jgi:hypothetical protein
MACNAQRCSQILFGELCRLKLISAVCARAIPAQASVHALPREVITNSILVHRALPQQVIANSSLMTQLIHWMAAWQISSHVRASITSHGLTKLVVHHAFRCSAQALAPNVKS